MTTTDIDWTAIATAVGAILALGGVGYATVKTVSSNEENIIKQIVRC